MHSDRICSTQTPEGCKTDQQAKKFHCMTMLQRKPVNLVEYGIEQITYNRVSKENDENNIAVSEGDSRVSRVQDLLYRHKMAMEKLIKMNQVFVITQTIRTESRQVPPSNHSTIFKQITLQHYLHLTLARIKSQKPLLVNKFNFYLRQHKQFYRFLQHLYYSYSQPIVNVLFQYIFFVWHFYYPSLQLSLTLAQSITVSNNISHQLFQQQQKVCISTHRLKPQRKNLLRGLTTTLVLVMQKHLINPLFESQQKMTQELMI